MRDPSGSKKTQKNETACTKCNGSHEGRCRWGGDVANPPATGNQCKFREAAAKRVVLASMVARGMVCFWPKQADEA